MDARVCSYVCGDGRTSERGQEETGGVCWRAAAEWLGDRLAGEAGRGMWPVLVAGNRLGTTGTTTQEIDVRLGLARFRG